MELMHDPQSKKRPNNLPEFLDLLKDNKQQRRGPDNFLINNMARGHPSSLMPDFANRGSNQRGGVSIFQSYQYFFLVRK